MNQYENLTDRQLNAILLDLHLITANNRKKKIQRLIDYDKSKQRFSLFHWIWPTKTESTSYFAIPPSDVRTEILYHLNPHNFIKQGATQEFQSVYRNPRIWQRYTELHFLELDSNFIVELINLGEVIISDKIYKSLIYKRWLLPLLHRWVNQTLELPYGYTKLQETLNHQKIDFFDKSIYSNIGFPEILLIIATGPDIQYNLNEYFYHSVSNNKKELAKSLSEYGTNVNFHNHLGLLNYFHFMTSNDLNIITMLLEYGTNPNTQDINGNSILMYASSLGWYYLAKLLLDHGADPNLHNIDGKTALIIASENNHMIIVNLLLKHQEKKNKRLRRKDKEKKRKDKNHLNFIDDDDNSSMFTALVTIRHDTTM